MRGLQSNSFNDNNENNSTSISPTSFSNDENKDDQLNNNMNLLNQNENQSEKKKKVLVLDLDDTLIHTIKSSYEKNQSDPNIEKPSKILLKLKLDQPLINLLTNNQINSKQNYFPVVYDVINLNYCDIDHYVCERPKVREFLQKVCELFEVFIYTSSNKKYAQPIIDSLCPTIDESHRKYGDLVLVKNDRNFKDLHMFNRQFSDILIVDDNSENLFFWPKNTIVCKKFSLNFEKCGEEVSLNDEQKIVNEAGLIIDQNYLIGELLPVLEKCASSIDVRDVIQESKRLTHFSDDPNTNFGLYFIESPKPLLSSI